MRARQLEVFRTIMRCGTLTEAARSLNVSQPALSQVLFHTEDELGFKLFDRVKGRLVPTPEAEELYPEVDRIFGDIEILRRTASELKAGQPRPRSRSCPTRSTRSGASIPRCAS
jgi:DNA-binding transcriptional LysR family regulator